MVITDMASRLKNKAKHNKKFTRTGLREHPQPKNAPTQLQTSQKSKGKLAGSSQTRSPIQKISSTGTVPKTSSLSKFISARKVKKMQSSNVKGIKANQELQSAHNVNGHRTTGDRGKASTRHSALVGSGHRSSSSVKSSGVKTQLTTRKSPSVNQAPKSEKLKNSKNIVQVKAIISKGESKNDDPNRFSSSRKRISLSSRRNMPTTGTDPVSNLFSNRSELSLSGGLARFRLDTTRSRSGFADDSEGLIHSKVEVDKLDRPTQKSKKHSLKLQLKRGDKIVYPGHGVGIIEEIATKSLGNESAQFYVVRLETTGMRLFIPVDQIQHKAIRKIIKQEEVTQILETIKRSRKKVKDLESWNRRIREYSEVVKNCEAKELAELICEFKSLNKIKNLSFGEKKILDTAKQLLASELSLANGTPVAEITAKLDELIGVY